MKQIEQFTTNYQKEQSQPRKLAYQNETEQETNQDNSQLDEAILMKERRKKGKKPKKKKKLSQKVQQDYEEAEQEYFEPPLQKVIGHKTQEHRNYKPRIIESQRQRSKYRQSSSEQEKSADQSQMSQSYESDVRYQRQTNQYGKRSVFEDDFRQHKNQFDKFAQNFYPQKHQKPAATYRKNNFEENYIKMQKNPKYKSKTRRDYSDSSEEEERDQDWAVKATKEGFLYFHIPGTKTSQWNFPRFYDPKVKRTRPYFVDNWVKKYDQRGKKYWQNLETQQIQTVKPDQETYLIQASILGNLAFLEVYIKAKGHLGIIDQQKRTALHHAVANGHKEFTAILCNFGRKYNLIESQDLSGCTPLFMAIKYNETECLKILISFDCNLFHRMKNEDTCMHVAAAYNSLNCMVILSSYGGFELLMERNIQGRRPIDIAEKLKNYECYQTLQKLERNLQFQNAILEREIRNVDGRLKKKLKTNRVQPLTHQSKSSRYKEGYQTTGRHDQRSRSRHQQKLRLDMISENSLDERIQNDSPLSDSEAEFDNLGGNRQYSKRIHKMQKEQVADQHQKGYMNQLRVKSNKLKKSHKSHRYDSDVPLFSNYDPKLKRMNSKPRKDDSYMSEEQKEQDYIENHSKQTFSRRENSRMAKVSSRANVSKHSYMNERDLDKTKNYFHLSIRDDNSIVDPNLRKMKTARDMFLMNRGESNNRIEEDDEENEQDNFDDEEMQYRHITRQPHTQRSQSRGKSQTSKERQSVIEQALTKTTSIVKSLGGFFKGGINKIKDYVFQEDNKDQAIVDRIRAKSAISQSRNSRRQNNSDLSDSSQYETPRGKSQTSRAPSKHRKFAKNEIVPQHVVDQIMSGQEYNSHDEQENMNKLYKKTVKVRPINQQEQAISKQNFEKSRSRGRIHYQHDNDKNIDFNNYQDQHQEIVQNKKQQKSIEIQADPNSEQMQKKSIQKQKQSNQNLGYQKQESKVSQKSVGVGSLRLNESSNTQSYQSNNSKKLQHSRMIQKEKKKRLGDKSKLLIQKNYQSSEDEKQQPKLNERSPSPAPRFMKEEIAYYKYQQQVEQNAQQMQSAFQQQEFKEKDVSNMKTQQEFQILTPSQRKNSQINFGTGIVNTVHSQNQRYQRKLSNSPSGPDNAAHKPNMLQSEQTTPLRVNSQQLPLNSQINKNSHEKQGVQRQSSFKAPNMLTQEQFDIIMLNSENEGASNMNQNKQQQQQQNIVMPQNNQYRIIDSDLDSQKDNKAQDSTKQQQIKSKNEDIKKFYQDLVQNISLTQIQEANNEHGVSQSIDETNLSNLYQRVMSKNGLQAKESEIKQKQSTQQIEIEKVEFNPDKDCVFPDDEDYRIHYDEFDNQESMDLMINLLHDFEQYDQISLHSFSDIENQKHQSNNHQLQSNYLDKGQFVGNSCISVQGGKQNTSAIQRPLMLNLPNNSMHHLNFQYQSDAESDYTNKKRGKLGKLNLANPAAQGSQQQQIYAESPMKIKHNLIPPNVQRSLQSSVNPLVPTIESENINANSSSAQQKQESGQIPQQIQNNQSDSYSLSTIILNQNNSKEQKHIIELFREDDEFERLNPSPQKNNFLAQNTRQIDKKLENQSLADELKDNFTEDDQIEYNKKHLGIQPTHYKKSSDQDYVQMEQNDEESGDSSEQKNIANAQAYQQEDQGMKRIFYEKLQQQFQEIDQKDSLKEESPKIVVQMSNLRQNSQSRPSSIQNDSNLFNSNQQKHHSKQNNRYDVEESMINWDVSSSKQVDQTQEILANQLDIESDDQNIQRSSGHLLESRQTLKTQIKQQIQSYVKQSQSSSHSNQNAILEAITLPLQILPAAYKPNEIQVWQEESHSLIDKDQLQKVLLGNMMSQAFSASSNMKLIKRNYLPYQGATSTTQLCHQDTLAAASGNIKKQSTNQSSRYQQVNSSQESYEYQVQPKEKTISTSNLIRMSVTSLRKSQNQGIISQDSIVQELDSISRIYDDLETVQEEEVGHTYDKTNPLEETKISQSKSKRIPKQQSNRYENNSICDFEDKLQNEYEIQRKPQPKINDIFYKKEGLNFLNNNLKGSNSSQHNQNGGEVEEQASAIAPQDWYMNDKQNRSTANAFLQHYLYTSSEDESKRKANNILANARPRIKQNKLLHSSVNAPLYQHGKSSGTGMNASQLGQNIGIGIAGLMQKKTIRDVSFKSNNVSTHTDGSERLKENLKLLQKNRLFKNKQQKSSQERGQSPITSSLNQQHLQQQQIVEQNQEESINLLNKK